MKFIGYSFGPRSSSVTFSVSLVYLIQNQFEITYKLYMKFYIK